MIADLHCHTTASDGALAPRELVQRAIERDVDLLAITDHDTVAAYADLIDAEFKLRLIHGIELSTQWRGHTIHVVGLGIDIDGVVMQTAVAQQAKARNLRAEKIGARLDKLGFAGALEGAAHLAGKLAITMGESFLKTPGKTITILKAGSLTGAFSNPGGQVVADDGTRYKIGYTSTSVTLTAP